MQLARTLAKSDDPSHAGKLALRPVARKDGRVTHHWMLPPGPGPMYRDRAHHGEPITAGRDKLEAALARPDIQDFLARTLTMEDRPPLSVDDFMLLCGLPPGSTIEISDVFVDSRHPPEALWFSLEGQNPDLHIGQARYNVHLTNHGPDKYNPNPAPHAEIELYAMEMLPGHTGTGLGTKMLLAQVKEMQRLGFTHIELEAQRDRQEYSNGYYTWPALGFDGRLPTHDSLTHMRAMYRELNGGYSLPSKLTTIQQLMHLPHGREIWKKYGATHKAKFDTRPGSPAVAFLEAYAQEKHYV